MLLIKNKRKKGFRKTAVFMTVISQLSQLQFKIIIHDDCQVIMLTNVFNKDCPKRPIFALRYFF